jgi:hypothetical protein
VLAADIQAHPLSTLETVFKEMEKKLGTKLDDPSLFQIYDEEGVAGTPRGNKRDPLRRKSLSFAEMEQCQSAFQGIARLNGTTSLHR